MIFGLKGAYCDCFTSKNKEWQLIGSMSLVYKYINDIRSTGWIQTQNIKILYKCLFHIWW